MSTSIKPGTYITDNNVKWLITDIRDHGFVGDIILSPILRPGYVKANGSLLSDVSTNYPRLVNFVQQNPNLLAANDTEWNNNKALYVYNSSNNTLRVPDATNRVLQSNNGSTSISSINAGLPNIKGEFNLTGDHRWCDPSNWTGTGAIRAVATANYPYLYGNGTFNGNECRFGFTMNASLYNSIYSDSINTVQPPAILLIAQIKY